MATAPAPPPTEVLKRLREQRIAAARDGINAFCELVLKDEQTGAPVKLASMHREWHRLASEHARLTILAHVESGKTSNLSVGRVLHELGKDRSLRCCVLSNTFGQAGKVGRTIASYIERSAELHAVFPELRPDPAGPWNETMMSLVRPTISKDPSIQCAGVHGNVMGSRIDLLVMDDIVDFENARTPQQRQDLVAWLDATVLGRLTARAKVIAIGTAFHPEDALHVFEARGWPTFKYAVEDEAGNPRWPERWPKHRIEAKRLELGPAESARQLDVEVRDDATAVIKQEWIDVAVVKGAKATSLSRDNRGRPYLLNVPPGWRTVLGIDLGVSKKQTADLSVIACVLVHPNNDREVLSIEAGRWHGPEIVDAIINAHLRFNASTVVVESNAAQAYVAHFLRQGSSVPVVPFTTGRGEQSLQWQVERLGTELARAQWLFPSLNGRIRDKETMVLARDLLQYTPTTHCPDRVAALCFARWGCEQSEVRAEVGYLDLMSR